MKNILKPDQPISRWTYVLVLVIWLFICFSAVINLIALDIREAEKDLNSFGISYSDNIDKEMIASETILKGFSALFSAIGDTEPEKVAHYVRSVIKENDQIFSLEISQKVPKNLLKTFESRKRAEGLTNFTVKAFAYESSREWEPLKDNPYYYPIIFIEPLPQGYENVLGLDLNSVPSLQEAMAEALSKNTSVATHPFKLIEGNLAYVVFCPIQSQKDLIADMVIDAGKLAMPQQFPIMDGWSVVIHHQDFKAEDVKGHLFAKSGNARSMLEMQLFPSFEFKKRLATNGQPFIFIVTKQIGWSDLNLMRIGLVFGLIVLSCLLLIGYMQSIQQYRVERIKNQEYLWKLANYDALTKIPNRLLLEDRLAHALSVSERNAQYGAIIFLDIDHFKALNDTKGHDAGDLLLVEVAKRLQECVRDLDTAARIGGDEFVVLLNDLGKTQAEADHAVKLLTEKISSKLQQPYDLNRYKYHANISLGFSLFYGNKQTISDLLKSADTAMYQAKNARHQSSGIDGSKYKDSAS